ncbi:retrovirus-related pol polyprotein from transposon 17.6 [Tanacetum coccineum]
MPPNKTTTPMTDATIKQLIAQGVADALVEFEATKNSENGDDSHDSGSGRRKKRATRECTYSDFLKCQPFNFKGTEGVAVGHNAAYGMTWKTFMKMLTDKYCLRGKIKKLEIEMWNLKVKGIDVGSYTQRFQELALTCRRMFLEESDQVEKYVGGLPDMIQGSVMASKPPQNVARAYSAGSSEKKGYSETLSLCNKCKFHHSGPCTVKYTNCKRVGHLTRDCRSPAATNNQRTLTCNECGNHGHYRSDCPELKYRNHGNQAGDTKTRGMVYALGGGETDQDLDNMKDDINV